MTQIYKITNTINNKLYIGKTNLTLLQRFKQHIYSSKKIKLEKRPLYSAFKKHGIENFSISLIEIVDENISNEREIFWIDFYSSFSCRL